MEDTVHGNIAILFSKKHGKTKNLIQIILAYISLFILQAGACIEVRLFYCKRIIKYIKQQSK